MLICLSSCNGGLGLKPTIIEVPRTTVIIPETISADLLTTPDCPEYYEIKWSDARRASQHYRECKNLYAQRIQDIAITVRGRWQWMRDEAKKIREDDAKIKAAATKKPNKE